MMVHVFMFKFSDVLSEYKNNISDVLIYFQTIIWKSIGTSGIGIPVGGGGPRIGIPGNSTGGRTLWTLDLGLRTLFF